MQEMQIDVADRHAKLRESVQRGFLGPPVEIIAPVSDELAQIGDIRAIGPGVSGRLVGETGAGKTLAKVGEVGVEDVKRERPGVDGHDRAPIGRGFFCKKVLASIPPRRHDACRPSCRRCALRTYIARSASSSALPASACGPRMATPADSPASSMRPPNLY